jgi:osmotically-inducible protein OsmY
MMKIKILAVLSLAVFMGLVGCRGNAGNTNANATNTTVNVATPTPVTKTNEAAATDPNMKSKIETALKAKGFTDVTVDTSTTPVTLRGTVAKGKLAELVATAQEATGKPVNNQVQEK